MKDLEVEVQQMARMIERKRVDGSLESLPTPIRDSATPLRAFHNFCTPYEQVELLQMAHTIPVSSSEAERSCLKLN